MYSDDIINKLIILWDFEVMLSNCKIDHFISSINVTYRALFEQAPTKQSEKAQDILEEGRVEKDLSKLSKREKLEVCYFDILRNLCMQQWFAVILALLDYWPGGGGGGGGGGSLITWLATLPCLKKRRKGVCFQTVASSMFSLKRDAFSFSLTL